MASSRYARSAAAGTVSRAFYRSLPRPSRPFSRKSDAGVLSRLLSSAGNGVGTSEARRRRQAALGFAPLPTNDASQYTRPGTYLVAHPMMDNDGFSRTVIMITPFPWPGFGGGGVAPRVETHGIVVNQESLVPLPPAADGAKFRPRTVREVLPRRYNIPPEVTEVFGDYPVRDGGPIQASLHMIRSARPKEEERLRIGGTILPSVLENSDSDTDKAVYFGGDMLKAAKAVLEGEFDQENFSFIFGSSIWETGQLKSEMERGYWLPCGGPPLAALTGMCEHTAEGTDTREGVDDGPKKDLWLSIMCALGKREADLAHLALNDERDDNRDACNRWDIMRILKNSRARRNE